MGARWPVLELCFSSFGGLLLCGLISLMGWTTPLVISSLCGLAVLLMSAWWLAGVTERHVPHKLLAWLLAGPIVAWLNLAAASLAFSLVGIAVDIFGQAAREGLQAGMMAALTWWMFVCLVGAVPAAVLGALFGMCKYFQLQDQAV